MLHHEPLSGGLVTSRDPSLLGEGELQKTNEAIYRPNSQAIHPVGYRVKQGAQQKDPGTGLPYTISGLRRLTFDFPFPRRTIIADGAGGRWRYGPNEDGNWVILPGVGAVQPGFPLYSVAAGTQYVLSNGLDAQWVLSGDLSVIPHGMQILKGTYLGGDLPGYTNHNYTLTDETATGGAWAGPLGTLAYWYWITEYDSENDLESAVLGHNFNHPTGGGAINLLKYTSSVFTSTRIIKIAIPYGSNLYPTKVNQNATHWRIYRSAPNASAVTDTFVDNPFPYGQRITTFTTTDSTTGTALLDIPIPAVPATTNAYDFGFDSADPYPIVIITAEGVTAAESRDVPPSHKFSSATMFEDSLVTNDRTQPNVIRYSPAGKIHSQPSIYFVPFDTEKVDSVQYVGTLGQKLIVGEKRSLWRVNYLPRGEDAIFDVGRVKEAISVDHGVVGPLAAAIYTIPGDIARLAFISQDGIFSTDGFTVTPLTMDLDWEDTVRKESLALAGLLNVERLKSLWMFYVPKSAIVGGIPTTSSTRLRTLAFSYAPEHLKSSSAGTMLKVSGPLTISCASADYDPEEGFILTGGYDGQVRHEDRVQLALTEIDYAELISAQGMDLQTRYVHLGGLEGECAIERFWLLSDSTPNPERRVETLGYTARQVNAPPKETGWSVAFSPGVLSRYERHVTAPGVAVNLQGFAPIHLVGLEHTPRKGN